MAPVIGVTATLREDVDAVAKRPLGRFVRADLDYVEGVAQAGGIPVVLPPVADSRMLGAFLDGMDGLLFSGGSDLHPSYYGEEPVAELGITIPERDEFEISLLDQALRRGIPVFGICRGMQILNVALGGTLYQDLPSQIGRHILEHRQEIPKWKPSHDVGVREDCSIREIAGSSSIEVNSYHHQGVKKLADDLVVSAVSPDGIIEAVESRDFSARWLLGVQWHAEAMRAAGPEHRRLFEAHVCAAERHALRRVAA